MTKKRFSQILFFGSLWGIVEATLGHVLHWIPVTIAGSIMFPIAGVILYKAYQETQSKVSLIYIGAVAASIKAVNFYLPQINIFKTINPMMSILMEAMVVVLVVTLLVEKRPARKYLALPIASISWRTLFVAWMGFQYVTTGNLAPYIVSVEAILQFVVISGLISGAMASALVYVVDHVTVQLPKLSSNLYIATAALVIALVTTFAL